MKNLSLSPSLTQPEETYRATYRGSRIVLAHANAHVSEPVAKRMAADIGWMREGDIDVRLHTLHSTARQTLRNYLPEDVFAERDGTVQRATDGLPAMIRGIAEDGRGGIEELMVLSKMGGLKNGDGRILPLLSDTRLDDLRSAHKDQRALYDAIEEGLTRMPKIVFTQPSLLGGEIRKVTGEGTMCFKRDATTCSPMYKREEPIFLENYLRNVADGTYRERSPEALQQGMDTHSCIRAGKSIIGGFSLIPQDTRRLSLELVWGCSRGGDLGPLILDHATQEAGRSSFYALTVREAVANIFRSYPGMAAPGKVSTLQRSGGIESYAPEHAHYDTANRDPYFFWHEGRKR